MHESLKENEKQQIIIAEKSKEIDNLMEEKNNIIEEFQKYKVKAQLALQQSSNSNGLEVKITELVELNSKLESQIA